MKACFPRRKGASGQVGEYIGTDRRTDCPPSAEWSGFARRGGRIDPAERLGSVSMDPASTPPTPPPTSASAAPSQTGASPDESSSRSRVLAASIGRQLGGDLPCVICDYNLKGLSIRSVCPECGAAVRATILSVVDPQANVLRPIPLPKFIACGLLAWAGGGLLATITCWLPNVWEGTGGLIGPTASASGLAMLSVVAVGISGLGSLALVRPHSGIPARQVVAAMLASVLYIPLARVVWLIGARHIDGDGPGYLSGWRPTEGDTVLAVSAPFILAAILLLQRPNARLLVARCVLLRSGKVDRQTLLAIAASAGVIVAGQLLGRWSVLSSASYAGLLRTLGLALVGAGAGLLVLGLIGSVLDTIRIARAIVRPRRTLRQVVRGHAAAGGAK